MTLHERLLRLLPSTFRSRHQAAMSAAFEEQLAAARARGKRVVARLWVREILDIGRTAVALRMARAGRTLAALLDALAMDVRVALRSLFRQRIFAVASIGTLALGIGGVTALWSAFYGVVLKPLPFPEAERIVRIWYNEGAFGEEPARNYGMRRESTLNFSYLTVGDYVSFATHGGVLADVAAAINFDVEVEGELLDQPAALYIDVVTPNFFSFVGVPMALGRGFVAEEGAAGGGVGGAAPSLVLAHEIWTSRFGGDPDVLGRTVLVRAAFASPTGSVMTRVPHTIVGVASPALRYLEPERDAWAPLAVTSMPEDQGVGMLGRLRPGVPPTRAAEELGALVTSWRPEHLLAIEAMPGPPPVLVETLGRNYLSFATVRLLLPLLAALLVLLLACANVANLLLSRLPSRRPELAMRGALGASRARLVRQLLTEAATLSAMAGLLGALLAWAGTEVISRLGPRDIPQLAERLAEAGVGLVPLLFCAGVAALSAALVGILPALGGTGGSILRSAAPGVVDAPTSGPGFGKKLLLAGQVALALVLLSGASLLVRSFGKLSSIELGFDPEGVVRISFSLPADTYREEPARWSALLAAIVEGLEADPRMVSASIANWSGYSGRGLQNGPRLRREGETEADLGSDTETWGLNRVSPGYFETLGIPLVRGRSFGPGDARGAPDVAIVNETFAERYWPGEDPIGNRFHIPAGRLVEVVGVVGRARDFVYRDEIPVFYFPLDQFRSANGQVPLAAHYLTVLVRTTAEESVPAALSAVLRRTEPRAAVGAMTRWREDIEARGLHEPRFHALIFGLFGILGAVIAAAGVFGVLAFLVSQRMHEIGVRLALGGKPRTIVLGVVREVGVLAGLGLVVGVAATLAGSRTLEGLLYGVDSTDAVSLAGATVLLLATAGLAAWWPLRAVARVDPARVLRAE